MSYVTIWIHAVWSTKNYEPLLHKEIRTVLFQHILENARKKGIWVDTVNGYAEHVHCLISLGKEQTISKIMMLLKGESSNWLNKSGLSKHKLYWQDDYFAVSVGQSQVERVRKHIQDQEEHHKKKSYLEEVKEFMEKYGWSKFAGTASG